MISAKLGHVFDKPLSPIAKRINVNPNYLTFSGFLITISAAFIIPYNLKVGGLLVIIGGIFDMLDGVIARTNGRTSDFGAFLDSVLDRFSDAAIFFSLAWYFLKLNNLTGTSISILTMIGALLISYARARAEGIGKKCSVGLLERPERIILVTIGCLTGWILPILWMMLALTYITVIQRVLYVRKITQ